MSAAADRPLTEPTPARTAAREPAGGVGFAAPTSSFATVDPRFAARLTMTAADIALVVDAGGIIRDYAIGEPALVGGRFADLVGQRWVDIVAADSRVKVEEMLRDTPADGVGRWRLINHPTDRAEDTLAVRYTTVGTGGDGRIVAIGRDQRALGAMQQRLLQAQQSMERDYLRLRQSESRYRLLFDQSSEAVLVVDAASGRFVEVNPAARRLVGSEPAELAGASFAAIFAPASRDAAAAAIATAAADTAPVEVRLAAGGRDCLLSATLFRHDKATYALARLLPVAGAAPAAGADARQMLVDVLERLPDAFVITDESLDILAENGAFLDLAQLARREHARGQSLTRFLGRPGIDLGLLVAHLREHGSVRNFATVFRSQFDTEDEVEISAVAVPDGEHPCFGFTIRTIERRLRDAPGGTAGRDLPRSVEQLTELVGRVSLKDIVRESTDLIERLCIEAALAYTDDNRASAAEILGLSRQSLYSKLHRHGLGNLVGGEN